MESDNEMEWINLSEDSKSNFTFTINLSFTKNISVEEAKKNLLNYIVYSAENLIKQDPANYFTHLKSVRVDGAIKEEGKS